MSGITERISVVFTSFLSTFRPIPEQTVADWAEANRVLGSEASSSPGYWRNERTPYLREIMECLSASSPVQEVVFMKGSQVGGSECGNNWVGYVMDCAPGPMLLVQPTVEVAKRYSRQRIDPMVKLSESLRKKVSDPRSRDAANNVLLKEFPGGVLIIGGANSAASLASMPIRYLFMDEVERYPGDVNDEGSAEDLAEKRTATFEQRKIFKCSSPGNRSTSKIEPAFLETDQRRYFVPCPDCGHMDWLRWSRFKIPRTEVGVFLPEEAHMICEACGVVITEKSKTDMLRRGEWRATAPSKGHKKRRGYHISALYSPVGWFSWRDVARAWVKAQGNPIKLKAFVNTVLGETWVDTAEKIDDDFLIDRAKSVPSWKYLPDGVLVITAGIDVQTNRIELEVVGWGLGEESWSLDYLVLNGDPEGREVWLALDKALSKIYAHANGTRRRIHAACIDTGGANTQAVYKYAATRWPTVFAIKGVPGEYRPVVGTPSKNNAQKVPLFPLGVHVIKDSFFGRLKIRKPGRGYCHFPNRPPEYFRGLLAEEVHTKVDKRGKIIREYRKVADRRNEPLDCRVYAYAALQIVYPVLNDPNGESEEDEDVTIASDRS